MEAQGIAPQLGRETKIKALGKWWTVGRLDVDIWEALLEWAKPRIISPLDLLGKSGVLKDMPAEAAVAIVRDALAQCPRVVTISHPVFSEAVETPEGKVHRWWLLLRQHQPDVTANTAAEILQEIGEQAEQDALLKANGKPAGRKKNPAASRPRGHSAQRQADELAGGNMVSVAGMQADARADSPADLA